MLFFVESEMPYLQAANPNPQEGEESKNISMDPGGSAPDIDESVEPEESVQQENEASEELHEPADTYLLARDRTRRNIRPPTKFSDSDFVYYSLCVEEELELNEPANYKEVIGSKNKERWIKSMNEEIESLLKNKTWILVLRSQIEQRPISCKWIYKRKVEASQGDNVRFKARLVARAFTQEEGIDFNEVFSPVVKHSSIRILLAIVAHRDWELHQLDVKTAFLHGELKEVIYMDQPQGYVKPFDELK